MLQVLERVDRTAGLPPVHRPFSIVFEECFQDTQSGRVRYNASTLEQLSLQIPLDKAVNTEEVTSYEERNAKRQKSESAAGAGGEEDKEEPVKPRVPMEACLDAFFTETAVEDYQSPVTGQKGIALKRQGISTFPKYLVLHMCRYVVGDDWRPKKLECLVPAPESLDLSKYRAKRGDEELLPDDAPAAAAAGPVPDASIVAQLTAMGFSENAGKRAALSVSNAGVEQAVEWAFEHNGDADFNDPVPAPG